MVGGGSGKGSFNGVDCARPFLGMRGGGGEATNKGKKRRKSSKALGPSHGGRLREGNWGIKKKRKLENRM